VCLRSSPLYNAGALAFNVGNETPRVGEVVTSLWNFAVNKLRFKVISPNGEKEKASPASAAGQPDVSPVVGSSKIS
jgi:E3 ubiquitin-protein ligase EDD1